MKKFIILLCVVVLAFLAWNYAYYQLGLYIDFHPDKTVTSRMKVEGKDIYMERDGQWEPFTIRGVDMGVGVPGQWATDYAIDKETYLRWFGWISEMGANTLRVYTILHDDFYNAFYEYNQEREKAGEEPLYLIHGVWVNDYMYNSHRDGFDDEIHKTFIQDCKTLVDVLHGKRAMSLGYGVGSGSYRKDVSPWVIGYILGVEWETGIVTYTNQKREDSNQYQGTYLYTTQEASPFEALLCEWGDSIIAYESERYGQQRLVAFSNWPTTDPFSYDVVTTAYRDKLETVDVEQIKATEQFLAGQFASYHVYSYFPDYLEAMEEGKAYTEEEIAEGVGGVAALQLYREHIDAMDAPSISRYLTPEDYVDRDGRFNTYVAYLRALNRYHTMPVVISEYGVTTGRGMAQVDENTGRNQGHMSEQEQGQAIIDCYEDIVDAGCAGSCVFSWQDEWFKRTWNTMERIDLDNTAYWSDYQTNEQYFGLLTFDPGQEESVCYVDGDISEWSALDVVATGEDMELSMKYDEKFLYFLVYKKNFAPEDEMLYIPIDTLPDSGSTYCKNFDVTFQRACEFMLLLKGQEDSRLIVQRRYETLLATDGPVYYVWDPYYNPPHKDTPEFWPIYLALKREDLLNPPNVVRPRGEKYETGALRHGTANPLDEEFDSLADFMIAGDYVEIRLPWQLLNFSNPSEMMIHDDYYENYGIENYQIDELYVGIGSSFGQGERIEMSAFPLKGWGRKVTSHERLKVSYYMLKQYWTGISGGSR